MHKLFTIEKPMKIPVNLFFTGAVIFIWLPIPLSAIRHLPAGTA
jgi:hypothetical protein